MRPRVQPIRGYVARVRYGVAHTRTCAVRLGCAVHVAGEFSFLHARRPLIPPARHAAPTPRPRDAARWRPFEPT